MDEESKLYVALFLFVQYCDRLKVRRDYVQLEYERSQRGVCEKGRDDYVEYAYKAELDAIRWFLDQQYFVYSGFGDYIHHEGTYDSEDRQKLINYIKWQQNRLDRLNKVIDDTWEYTDQGGSTYKEMEVEEYEGEYTATLESITDTVKHIFKDVVELDDENEVVSANEVIADCFKENDE